jgi:hypothetical protein
VWSTVDDPKAVSSWNEDAQRSDSLAVVLEHHLCHHKRYVFANDRLFNDEDSGLITFCLQVPVTTPWRQNELDFRKSTLTHQYLFIKLGKAITEFKEEILNMVIWVGNGIEIARE